MATRHARNARDSHSPVRFASSHLAFDKIAAKRFAAHCGCEGADRRRLEHIDAALVEYDN